MNRGNVYRRWQHPRAVRLTLFTILVIHTGLLVYGAYVHSPTLNEPAHLVAGLSHWKFGRFELYRVNPPLIRMIGAVPVAIAGYEEDWSGFYEGTGARPVFAMGEQFAEVNQARILWLITIARWACLPFSWIGALICCAWTRDLVGLAICKSGSATAGNSLTLGIELPEGGVAPNIPIAARWAGVWAAGLWCFSPNILAHAQLMTADASAAALGLAACYTFWKWLRKPTWTQAMLTGLVLGLAELAKSTLILFYPIWPLLWIVYRWPERRRLARRDWGREGAMLLVRMIIGIYVLNLGYGFEGSGTRLGQFHFVSKLLTGDEIQYDGAGAGANRFADTIWGSTPVPLPKNYVLGIDIQQRDFEDYGQQSYLWGTFQDKGWWYYYLCVIGVKVPLGMWLLAAIAAITAVRAAIARTGRLSLRDQLFLLVIPGVLFSVASFKDGFSQHGRYVLPCFPFLYVWVASVVGVALSGVGGRPINDCRTSGDEGARAERPRTAALHHSHDGTTPGSYGHARCFLTIPRNRLLGALVCVATIWAWSSSLVVYPHTLSYFNELAGGPMGGPRCLLHSNIDWGQDLWKLRRWMDQHPDAWPMHLAYYGSVDPAAAGIVDVRPVAPVAPLEDGKQAVYPPGWYAISVNFVYGVSYPAKDGAETNGVADRSVIDSGYWKSRQSDATVGYSIYLYRVQPAREEHKPGEAEKREQGRTRRRLGTANER